MWKNETLRKSLRKMSIQKNPNIWAISCEKENMKKKNKYEENLELKGKYEKKCEEIPEPKREYEKNKYEENPEPRRKYEENKYDKNPESRKENRKKKHKKNKKCLNKVETFCQ